MRQKYARSFFCGAIVFALLLFFFSQLVEPKYVDASREGNLISEYYRERDGGLYHDVVFIGDCEAYSTFIPPVIYENYGITSFVRGSPSQSMAQSYYLLCETLRYEKPRAIVFSIYAMCKSKKSSEAYNRLTLDGMRFSYEKLCAVRQSANPGETVLSYYIPLLRFHSRIFELEPTDLEYLLTRPEISHNGYFMQTDVVPFDGKTTDYSASVEAIPTENFEYLEKMRQECVKRGVELILVKAPTSSWRYPWYAEWDVEIMEYAKQNGLSYYNLIESTEDIGIDLRCDSYDGGMHLNVYGAEKTSLYFGEILHQLHGMVGVKNDAWEKKVIDYYKERNNEQR